VAGVGALGVPVNDGEFKFALLLKDVFKVAISVVLEVILEVAVLTLDVKLVMSDELEVILEAFDNILESKAPSTNVALVTSAVILDVLAFTFVVSVLIVLVLIVILEVFAAIDVGIVAMVDELTPPTLFTVVAKLPVPVPVTSPVNIIV
jgi:hypothetical protein